MKFNKGSEYTLHPTPRTPPSRDVFNPSENCYRWLTWFQTELAAPKGRLASFQTGLAAPKGRLASFQTGLTAPQR
ncbi:MAG: hypothetical protein MJA27_14595 [Pseudanabaenales cyanobacterium]|nr:hypothetical protein [Pseudanabaenales cyanobacterium]